LGRRRDPQLSSRHEQRNIDFPSEQNGKPGDPEESR
jgi:hypothetical protein